MYKKSVDSYLWASNSIIISLTSISLLIILYVKPIMKMFASLTALSVKQACKCTVTFKYVIHQTLKCQIKETLEDDKFH